MLRAWIETRHYNREDRRRAWAWTYTCLLGNTKIIQKIVDCCRGPDHTVKSIPLWSTCRASARYRDRPYPRLRPPTAPTAVIVSGQAGEMFSWWGVLHARGLAEMETLAAARAA